MAKQNTNSKAAAKASAEAAKARALAEQKRRDRRVALIGVGVVVVILVAIVSAVVISKVTAGPVALPLNVSKTSYGYSVGHAGVDKPYVQLFEDFQCPICKQFQQTGGPAALENAALAGKIRLDMQPMLIIDQSQGNDSSLRSTAAWGCAIDKGVGLAYHTTVFKNQPSEGVGYTDAQLTQFGLASGITGTTLAAMTDCMNSATYQPWAKKAADYAASKGVNGTPTILVNGKVLDIQTHAEWFDSPTKLLAAVNAAAAKK